VEALKLAIKTIDKAAAKNIIHKNTAARKKSKLVKALNAASNNNKNVLESTFLYLRHAFKAHGFFPGAFLCRFLFSRQTAD